MKKGFLKFVSLIIICQMLFLMVPSKAEAIPTTVVADVPAMIKMIKDFMIQVAFAAAKKGAIQGAIKGVYNAVGNGPNGPSFITDWRDALQAQPEKATKVQMQNLFTTMGAGAGTSAVDGSTGYVNGMLTGASNSVLDMSIPDVINMAEYGVDNPSQVFNGKNMRAFLTAFGSTSKIGNKIEATLFAQDMKNKYAEINQRLAQAQAVANGGYKSKMSNGMVITPGSSIRDLMASAQNASLASLTSANTIQEVVAALVSRVVSNTVKKGIAQVKQDNASEINTATNAYSAASSLTGSFGSLEVKKK